MAQIAGFPLSARALYTLRLTLLVVGLLPAAWCPAYAQAPPPCLTNFVSPLFVPLSGRLTELIIDDQCQHVYLTNASNNTVEVFSLQGGSLQAPIQVGSTPTGLDTSPDGGTLYVANSGANTLSVVDLGTGLVKLTIPVPQASPFPSNDTPYSLAVAKSGLVLFSTTFPGTGFGARVLQFDPVSNAVSPRTDFGPTTELTSLRASGDRSAIGVVVGDLSFGTVSRYSSATNAFTFKLLNAFVSFVALDGSGSTILVNPGTFVLDSTLNLAGTIPGGTFGVAVDPAGAIGYQVGLAQIDILDLKTFTKTNSLAVGDTLNRGAVIFGLGVGKLAISRDGTILAVITDNGFSLVQTGVARLVNAEVRDVSPDTAVAFGASETFLFRGTSQVLVAADRSGMHRSDDLGNHWRRDMKGLVDAATGIEPLAALVCQAPSARSTVYVPSMSANDPLLVDRPYRSDDFGATWRPLAGLVNAGSADCAVDPMDPQVLYVLAADNNDGHELLFKSIDGGLHFSAVGSGLEQNDCPHSMRVSPHNRNTVYVLDNGTFGGLYVSADGGLHFARSPSSPANPGTCALGVTEVLFFHPTEPETLFVVTLSAGLFRSTDGGATFKQPSGLPASAEYIAFDPSDAHTSYVAAGTAGLYRSTDDGASYSRLPGPTADQLGHFGVQYVGIPPGGASIYISTSSGLLRSDDGGQTFVPSQDDFHGAVVNDLAFDATDRLLVGTFHTLQLFRGAQPGHPEPYESPGAAIRPGGETVAIAASPTDANVLLVALATGGGFGNGGVFRTDNGGATWTSVSGIATPIRTFGRLTFAPSDASRAYYVNIGPGAVAGFYRSIDEGRSFAHTFQERLGSVAADPSNANTIYVGSWDDGNGLFKSTDGGLTFTSLPLTVSQAGDFGSLAIDPTQPQTVYAGRRQGGVLRSDDGGATWSFVSGFPGGEVLGVALDPQRPAHVFAWIQGAGLFLSDDRGGTWRAADTGEAKRRSGVEAGRGTLVADPKVSGRVYIGNSGVVQIDTEE